MDTIASAIRTTFQQQFPGEPLLVRSPGRINLIGEHTDYNDGFVMPAAIDKEIIFAIQESPTSETTIFSARYNEKLTVDLASPEPVEKPKWANYLLGVLHQMVRDGMRVRAFNCVFGGEVPLGAGLSSSAALECGFAFALNALFKLGIPPIRLIKMAQWSEHHYVGVKCGIMDQFASVMGRDGHVILLDCRSLEYRYVPLDLMEHSLILCDTKVKHSLVDSEYNNRRDECERGVAILKKHYPHIASLRDVTPGMLELHRAALPGKIYNRCLYVVQEILRVQEASQDLGRGDLASFGKKMYTTHEGLSTLYEVSCPELDFLVNQARNLDAVLGSRMMGGGFGGCTISVVKKDFAGEFTARLTDAYRNQFSIDMPVYPVAVRGGTSVLTQTASLINE